MDRNTNFCSVCLCDLSSLSARRVWIEIACVGVGDTDFGVVALRKESVDRNQGAAQVLDAVEVALRKESVDRNTENAVLFLMTKVALRKESVDRNFADVVPVQYRRVALRKESVDRNRNGGTDTGIAARSLSARRVWIEIGIITGGAGMTTSVALRKESVDRNIHWPDL